MTRPTHEYLPHITDHTLCYLACFVYMLESNPQPASFIPSTKENMSVIVNLAMSCNVCVNDTKVKFTKFNVALM